MKRIPEDLLTIVVILLIWAFVLGMVLLDERVFG